MGGLQTIDGGEADDKIVAVLENDNIWGEVTDISDLPEILVERLRHYFSTYKLVPGKPSQFTIEKVYGCEYAFRVIAAAIAGLSRRVWLMRVRRWKKATDGMPLTAACPLSVRGAMRTGNDVPAQCNAYAD